MITPKIHLCREVIYKTALRGLGVKSDLQIPRSIAVQVTDAASL